MNRSSTAVAFLLLALARPGVGGEPPIAVSIPMRDGAVLAADLYLPGAGAWPAILVQTPYGKALYGGTAPIETDDYAVVVVDWRGYAASSGAPEGSTPGQDGYDCVEWIAAQPWSDGAVGTWGSSALGIRQFQTAAEHPPHLRAAVPQFADPLFDYEQFFLGGVLKSEYLDFLGLFGFVQPLLVKLHPSHDALWSQVEAEGDLFDEIATPMLVVGGWYDLDTKGVVAAYESLVTVGDPAARDDHRLLIGPWTHADEAESVQGELEYPAAAGVAAARALVFFDRWLRGIEPPEDGGGRVEWFEMGTDTWRHGNRWPPSGGAAVTAWLAPDERLDLVEGPDSGALVLASDPGDPSPTTGGPRLTILPTLDGPVDLRSEVESRADVAIFTSDRLGEPLTVAGAPRVFLDVSLDRLDGDVVLRLADVYPDGRSIYVTEGARRARYRFGFETPELMVPGVVEPFEIDLAPVALTFLAGHRVRLDVTAANAPRLHVNHNDGGRLYIGEADALPIETTLHLGTSRLELPIASTSCPEATLCIDDEPGDARFQIGLHYDSVLGGGVEGDAQVIPLEPVGVSRGGILSFFGPENPEVLVKVLDGCAIDGHFWVFYAATTTVGFEMVVTDALTGTTVTYTNPDQTVAETVTDTVALATCDATGSRRGSTTGLPASREREVGAPSAGGMAASCVVDATTLCIDHEPDDRRFRITLDYETALGGGSAGEATATALDSLGIARGGILSFFGADNPEVLVKVLDGCGINDRFWVFYAATTTVGFELTVEDTTTGLMVAYTNPDLSPAVPVTDTEALAGCP